MRFQKARIVLTALFVLMQFYLIFLKRYDTLDVEATPNTIISPPVAGAVTVGQSFFSRLNGLDRVDIMMATRKRTLPKDIVFKLWEGAPGSKLVAEASAAGPSVRDNFYHPFRFKAVRRSKGKSYTWELSSPSSAPDEGICVWMNPREIYRTGELMVGRRPAKGDCVFRVYFRRPVVTELWRINRRYPGFLRSPFLLYTVVLAFEASLILLLWRLLGLLFAPAAEAGTESAFSEILPEDSRRKNSKRVGGSEAPQPPAASARTNGGERTRTHRALATEAGAMPDILFLSDDVVGPRMAGPGIRAWELAKVLARRFKVILAAPENSPGEEAEAFFRAAPLEVVFYSPSRPAEVTRLAESARLLVVQGYVLSKFPALKSLDLPIAADIYDPFVLETLFIHQRKIPSLADRAGVHLRDLRVWNDILGRGDHFLVASDRQKDLVTGGLLSLNRIGPEALDAGDDLGHLLSVVPFGISEEDGQAYPEEFGRAFPGIKDGDILLLWGGVLSDWFDPPTLLRAFKTALVSEPRLKLLFLSTGHPNPVVPPWESAREARALAVELGLEGGSVFFHDGWVEYLRRAVFFRRADIGVSIHRTHFETRYAFRTRMLDYIKHGLPILCTEGDYFAELVERERLGRVVGSGDEAGLGRAIVELAADETGRREMKARLLAARERFLWERAAAPLVCWCERILAGELRPISRPGREEVIRVCAGNGKSRVREGLRRMARPLVQKLPLRARARLARLFKI